MASRIYAFDAEVVANVAKASPTIVPTEFTTGIVEELQIIFPDGCAGLVGLQLANSYGQVIPYGHNQWIRGNNEVISWPVEDFVQTGSWQAYLYNEDVVYEHTLQIRFLVSEVGKGESFPVAIIPASRIEPIETEGETEEATEAEEEESEQGRTKSGSVGVASGGS